MLVDLLQTVGGIQIATKTEKKSCNCDISRKHVFIVFYIKIHIKTGVSFEMAVNF